MARRRQGPGVAWALMMWTLGALAGAAGMLAWQARTQATGQPPEDAASDEPSVVGHTIRVARQLMEPSGPSRVVYLNREGGRLKGGPDDAAYNVSSVVGNSPVGSASVPPFSGSATRWRAITKCIRAKFAPFNVEVVESRPVNRDYLMVMMGGRPKDLGFVAKDGHAHSHSTGLAPFNGLSIPRAIVFVFTRALRESTTAVCETAGMEIAHAYGLDHARNCRDLMTYMRRCGKRTFLDKDIACGEHKDRPCQGGGATQNSYQRLLEVLGPAPATSSSKPAG